MSDTPILSLELNTFEQAADSATKDAVAARLVESLNSGFVFVDAGISEAFLDEVYGKLNTFFTAAAEIRYQYADTSSKGSRGYTGIGIEKAEGQQTADFKHMLNWGRTLPPGHWLRERFGAHYAENVFPDQVVPGIGELLTEFHRTVENAQRRILRILAWHFNIGADYFDHMTRNGTTLARAIHYPAMDTSPQDGQDHIWAARHRDINLITVLPRATEKGLQLEVEGEWLDVAPPPGHAVVNTGMMLDRVTNGTLGRNGYHRVIADPDNNVDRLSIVQFCHPAPHIMLEPAFDNGQPRQYPTVTAGDALDEVLDAIGLGANTLTS